MENILKAAGKAIVFILALTWPSLSTAQDAGSPSGSGDKKKKTRIVIIKDENGKVVKTDTTIMGDGTFVFDDHDFDFDFDFDFDMPDMEGLHEFKFDDENGYAFSFDDHSQLTDEEKAKLKEEMGKAHKEMAKARKEMKKAREEMRKQQREAIREELEKAREEMKKLNREELEQQMEKLREELLEMKHNMKSERHMKWKHKGGPKAFRVMVGEDGKADRKCLIVMNGDTIVCKGMAGCKEKAKAMCGGKDKQVRILKFRDGDDETEEIIIEMESAETPEWEERTAEPAAPAAPSAPTENTAPATPATPVEEDLPGSIAQREVVRSSDQKIALRNLAFYPNPTSGQFRLSFDLDTPGKANIRLVDYAGRELFREEAIDFPGRYSKQFDVSGSAKGSYLLMISQGDKWVHEKLVVN